MLPTGLPFTMAPPGTPGPPGTLQSANLTASSSVAADSSSSTAAQRPSMPTATATGPVQPQMGAGAPYASLPALAGLPPQGVWLQQRPQMVGGGVPVPRVPIVPYTATFPGPGPGPGPGPFPLMPVPRGFHLPSVSIPDSQPPGVTPVSMSSTASSHQLAGPSGMHSEVLTSSGDRTSVNDVGIQDRAAGNEQLDAWAAHKTEAGVVYYYNALTGESTYDKPADFIGELSISKAIEGLFEGYRLRKILGIKPDKVSVQPIPVSMVNLPGTDWVLVTTTDGKSITTTIRPSFGFHNINVAAMPIIIWLVSSWQIPNEVTELRKKQEGEISKENLTSLPNTNVVEKGSSTITLNTPAINTGGRDAMTLRPSGVQTSSPSALDLIKKKLQDSELLLLHQFLHHLE
ncbi:hypothetical protein FNV43_RR26500 [Rhamnella rubrinervis]|uniref:WW domain-containing protein n=1 Tax=Rhamnella rubrinervis TaxID=2594499 RepID=A0A8K0DPF3_9ROSA|nr:hypothetical protein FNV43_RR26500 [Rhamnella rubrinervis]